MECRLYRDGLSGFVIKIKKYPIFRGRRPRPPVCHSEPLGEESRFAYFYFVLLAILRFAQDDKLGFVGVLTERSMTVPYAQNTVYIKKRRTGFLFGVCCFHIKLTV